MESYIKGAGTHPIKILETLDIIIAYANVNLTIAKMTNSLGEIKEKNPKRTDLIESLQKSIDDLNESMDTFRQMEINLIAQNRRNLDLEIVCLKIQSENNELKRKTNNILDAFDSGKIEFVKG